jgi:hypothetical protein
MIHDSWRDRYYGPKFGIFRIAFLVIGGVVFAVLFAFLFGWLVELLWNWLMPGLFGLKAISYWQAFGLVVLAKILFGCGKCHNHSAHHRRHWLHFRKHLMNRENCDQWRPHGAYSNWKYYDQYWREEGKAAFEAYIDRIEKERHGGT